MLLIHEILGRYDDRAFNGRARDKIWITAADAGRRRLRAVSENGEQVGIDLPRPDWLFDGAVVHDDTRRILVVARRPELVMVVALSELEPSQAFQIGHALGNRHTPAEFRNDEILVPVTDTPDLTARPVRALGFRNIQIRFEERAFAADAPPSGATVSDHGSHRHLHD
ncbi:urease accessory protein UreE [Marinobacter sp. ST-43]|jgi:urease accessory protein|uniref:urease accessory protein UreE n=1 Tax=Marinobacter sp. ST-43 TaxID=3050453 RepID=UPI0034A5ADDE